MENQWQIMKTREAAGSKLLRYVEVNNLNQKLVVQRLEDLAFEVSRKEILASFQEFRSYFTEESARESVNAYLNQHLVGVLNDIVRKKHVLKFFEDYCNDIVKKGKVAWNSFDFRSRGNTGSELPIDVWEFFNCILDHTFEELEISYASYPDIKFDPYWINVVAQNSSLLKKMSIDFCRNEIAPCELCPVVLGLGSFQHLTTLSVQNLNKCCKPVLKLIGKSCPVLSHLIITGFKFKKKDILAIFLGDLIHILFTNLYDESKWGLDASLERLVVPTELLTPICFTLKSLQLGSCVYKGNRDQKNTSSYLDSTFAFILRHVPLLQELEILYGSVAMAIKILHDIGLLGVFESQAEFEKVCQEAASEFCVPFQFNDVAETDGNLSGEFQFLNVAETDTTPSSTFCGTLQLTSLRDVTVLHPNVLRMIAKMCPLLKDVSFFEESVNGYHLRDLDEYENPEKRKLEDWDAVRRLEDEPSQVSPEDLESIFSDWPKLQSVTIVGVSPKFVKAILKSFGSELESLTFESCLELDLTDLMLCIKLKSLFILDNSTLDPEAIGSNIIAHTFLPQLISIEAGICLSTWAYLFEGKSALTHVFLNCFHLGTVKDANVFPEWNSIPSIWPLVQRLFFRQCSGLTLAMVSDIAPQLDRLNEIILPHEMRYKELNEFQRNASYCIWNKYYDETGSCMSLEEKKEELFRPVMEKCYNRSAPIDFCFEGYSRTNGGDYECPFQPFEDIYNNGDDTPPNDKSDTGVLNRQYVYYDTGSIDGDYYDNIDFGLDDYDNDYGLYEDVYGPPDDYQSDPGEWN